MKKNETNPILDALADIGRDEAKAVELFEEIRWRGNVACPLCNATNVYAMQSAAGGREKNFRWRCRACLERFTVRTRTAFAETRIPMWKWARAYWMACASKKGCAALQLKREIQVTYTTALFVMHRIRFGMAEEFASPIGGPGKDLECDETYVGGKPRNRAPGRQGITKKAPVVALVERGGEVRARVITRVTGRNVRRVLLQLGDTRSRLLTDESSLYIRPGALFQGGHETTNHGEREYARGDVHSNSAESFFARVKRGLYGVNHAVSKNHLHRYVSHWEFLHNTRFMDDGERTATAIQRSVGKRLVYLSPAA